MSWKKNVFTDKLDYYEKGTFKGTSATPPGSPQDGWTYVDSDDNSLYMYYCGTWTLLHVLLRALSLEDGFFILQEDGTSKLILES